MGWFEVFFRFLEFRVWVWGSFTGFFWVSVPGSTRVCSFGGLWLKGSRVYSLGIGFRV